MTRVCRFAVGMVGLVALGGCCPAQPAPADVDRSAIRVGMTQQEVEDVMRPVSREHAVDHQGNTTGVVYDTGDNFVFVNGRLRSHTVGDARR